MPTPKAYPQKPTPNPSLKGGERGERRAVSVILMFKV